MKHFALRLGAFSTCAALVTGCADMSDNVPENQQKAGSGHVTVSMIGPWKKFVEQTQPTFALSTTEALSQAIPETSDLDQLVLNQLQASLQAGIKADAPAAPSSAPATQTIPTANSSLGKPLAEDAFTRFWAANSLYEEVQILNKSLKYAPKQEGFHNYLIQTQVSMMPYLRDEPVDAYTTLSFWASDFDKAGRSEGVKVLPILVTDDLETQAETKSREQLMSYALSLVAALHSVNLGASFSDTYENLKTVIGSNYNSAFTVESDSANTIRCRFGAQYESKNDYALNVQNHKVTLLIMVPEGVTNVLYMAKTSFKDLSGNEIPTSRTYGNVHGGVYELLDKYGLVKQSSLARATACKQGVVDGELSKLVQAVEDNNSSLFSQSIRSLGSFGLSDQTAHPTEQHYLEHIWSELVDIVNTRSQVSTGNFALSPYVSDLPKYLTDQTPVLIDDGSGITANVRLANSVGEQGIQAYISDKLGKNEVFATSTKIDDDGNATLSFPMVIGDTGVDKDTGKDKDPDKVNKLDKDSLKLTVCKGDRTTILSVPAMYSVKKPDLPFKASVHASFIVSQQGVGSVALTIDTNPGKLSAAAVAASPTIITIAVDGADISSVSDSPLDTGKSLTVSFTKGNWTATGQGSATINLTNLTPSQSVTVTTTLQGGSATQSKILAVSESIKEPRGLISP